MRLRFLLPALVLVGCSQAVPGTGSPATMPSGTPLSAKASSALSGLKVAMDNQSPYFVGIEPMSALRSGGSNVFGPPEETQPGKTKVVSKTELGGFFGGIDGVTSPPEAVIVHVQASEDDNGQAVKEAYIVVSRMGAEKSPGTLKIKADAKGVAWFGPAAGTQPWIELRK